MKRLLKWIFGLVFGLVLLLVMAVTLVAIFVDPNDYRDDITAAVKAKTGRDMQIAGPIDLTLVPWLGVELNDVTLANAEEFGPDPFAHLSQAQSRLSLFGLLGGDIVVDRVTVDGLVLNLARKQDGRDNWSDLVASLQSEEPASAEAGGGEIPDLTINAISVSDVNLNWRDDMSGQQIALSDISLKTGQIRFAEPFSISGGLGLNDAQTDTDLQLSYAGQLAADPGSQQYRIDSLDVDIDGHYGPTPISVSSRTRLSADLEAGTVNLAELLIEAWNTELRGEAQLSGLQDQMQLTAELTVPDFSPAELLQRLEAEPPAMRSNTALKSAGMNLTLSYADERAELVLKQANLDDIELSGQISLQLADIPVIRGNFDAGQLDLTGYLPPASESDNDDRAAAPSEAVASGASSLPLDLLDAIDLELAISAAGLQIETLRVGAMNARVVAAQGQMRVHPLTADFYQGRYEGDIRIDARQDPPQLSMDEQLQGVSAAALTTDLLGAPRVSGTAGIGLRTTADISSPGRARETVSGELALDFADGAVMGLNIADMVQTARTYLGDEKQGAEVRTADTDASTDFSSFQLIAPFEQGVLNARTLTLDNALVAVTGSGAINLAQGTVELTLRPALKSVPEGVDGRAAELLADIQNVPIPFRVSGALDNISYRLDVAGALDAIKQQKLNAARERIGAKANEELGRAFRNLLGEDDDDDADDGSEGNDD